MEDSWFDGLSFEAVCRHLYLDDSTVREWHRRYQHGGIAAARTVPFHGGAPAGLDATQHEQLKAWLSQRFCRSSAQLAALIQAQFGVAYSRSGLGKLLGRLDFDYKKPTRVPAVGDAAAQRCFIADDEACLNQLGVADRVYFVDAVHPEYQSRPAFGWGVRGEPVAVRQTPGRMRMNLHGALCLEDFSLELVESLRIDAASTLTLLQRLQIRHPGRGSFTTFSTTPAITMPARCMDFSTAPTIASGCISCRRIAHISIRSNDYGASYTAPSRTTHTMIHLPHSSPPSTRSFEPRYRKLGKPCAAGSVTRSES